MPDPKQPGTQAVTHRLRNARATSQTLILEPWGESYLMAPGAVVEVVARGPDGDHLEVEIGEGEIILWGWPGSVVSVIQDGIPLGGPLAECPPVPATPQGTDTRRFLRQVLGRTDDSEPPPPGDRDDRT